MVYPLLEFWNQNEDGTYEVTPIEYTWRELRALRDSELARMDEYLKEDYPMGDDRQALLDYRQALRDIPQNYEDESEAVANWPTRPEWMM